MSLSILIPIRPPSQSIMPPEPIKHLFTLFSILDKSNLTVVIYLDFSKAFGTLPHYELLFKQWSFGISDPCGYVSNLTSLKENNLCKLHEVASSSLPVASGIPQASKLGLLVFLIYINDLPAASDANSDICMFADDTKLMPLLATLASTPV